MAVPAIPAAAYRASIPPPGSSPGPTIGVSGGGGEPLVALVVEIDAVDANLFMALGAIRFSDDGVPLSSAGPGTGGG